MPPEQTQILESLSFDGPLAAWQGVLLGCALAGIAFWALFRVPRRARRKITPLLWALRIAAIAIVVWMLLGPVNITTYRHLTPKSLAIITDVSASMNVVDPPDGKSDLRWSAVGDTGPAGALVSACDQAAVAAVAARDGLNWLVEHAANTAQPELARRKLQVAGRAASNVAERTEAVCRLLDENSGAVGPELASRAKDIASAIASSKVAQLETSITPGTAGPLQLDPDELNRLEQMQRQMVQTSQALAGLAERIADRLAANAAAAPRSGYNSAELLARAEKVQRLIDTGEKNWLADRVGSDRIRHYTFDRVADAVVPAGEEPNDGQKKVSNGQPSKTKSSDNKAAHAGFTNLSAALERVNRESAEAGTEAVLLFTDGRHNDPAAEDPRIVAKAFSDLPIHIVPVGTSQLRKDLILHHVDAPNAVVDGDQVLVEGILSAFGCEGESCVVELTEGNAVVHREEIRIDSPRRDLRMRMATTAKGTGRHEYALTVSALDGEAVATNNGATFGVDVIDATLRVLLADDLPRWEYRYLVNLFERDERIQYEQLLFHPNAKGSGDMASTLRLPRDVEGWSRFRVAILGDLSPTEFDPQSQSALREYLTDRGGTVILIAGSQAMPQAYAGMPLNELLPVVSSDTFNSSQGYGLELSAEGRLIPAMQIGDQPGSSEQIWKEMSERLPIYSLSSFCMPKPAARTLIQAVPSSTTGSDAGNMAFLCWQTVGRGRVVYLAAPAIYQLRLRYGDRFHYRFWGQLIRWAVARDLSQGSKTVKLTTDRSRIAVGENVQIVANLSSIDGQPLPDAEVRAQASMDGTPAALVGLRPDPKIPGRYLGEFAPNAEGTLTLQAVGADVTQLLSGEGFSQPVETSVVVDPEQSTETEDTRANTPLLQQIAGLTGGQLVPPTAVDELIQLTDLEPNVREETVRGPLWNRWTLLWLLCGVLSIEWTLRKSTGLP